MTIDPDTITLDERQRCDLAAVAEQTGKPWSLVLSEALAAYRQRPAAARSEESFYDAAMRLGLVGCLKSGISDLSTNPIHMEGFGEDHRADCG